MRPKIVMAFLHYSLEMAETFGGGSMCRISR